MVYDTIVYTKKDHIAKITLNRPEVDNIINQQLAQEVADVCCQINRDDDIYVAIITGAGDKAFCGGSEPEQLNSRYNPASAIASIDRPVIAVINGDALGQGLELALSCDIRLASNKARFGLPQVALGLIPTDGGTQRLPRIIGKTKALELILTGEVIDAEENHISLSKRYLNEDDEKKQLNFYELNRKLQTIIKKIAVKLQIDLNILYSHLI